MYKYAEFGQFVREKREKMGYSREYLAELSSMSDKCIANIEQGKSNPKLTTVLEICSSCNINIGELEKFIVKGFLDEI